MFKFIARWFAVNYLTPEELLRMGYVSDKLKTSDAMEVVGKLLDRHQYNYNFDRQEELVDKVLNTFAKRTADGTVSSYLQTRVSVECNSEEILKLALTRVLSDERTSRDVVVLGYPLFAEEVIQKALQSEERNIIKRRAALVKEVKAVLGNVPNDVAQLIVSLAEEIAKIRS